MNKLPLDVENSIWKMYYMDNYKKVINELKGKRIFFREFNRITTLMVNYIMQKDHFHINKSDLTALNCELLNALNDKSFFLLYKKYDYINYVYQVTKFKNPFSGLPESCRFIGAFLYKKSNFNKKFYKRLKVIASGENILFSKMIENDIQKLSSDLINSTRN